jgi:hypothetical protein
MVRPCSGPASQRSLQGAANARPDHTLGQKQRVRDSGVRPPETDHVLSASLGQSAELSGEVVQHSNVVKSFQFYSARQHADQASRCTPPRHTIAASSVLGRRHPGGPPERAGEKLDCEESRQSIAISLSEADVYLQAMTSHS